MHNCWIIDIETSSVKNTGGRFLVHNVGWVHNLSGVAERKDVEELVAQTVEELAESTVMWDALEKWKEIAKLVKKGGLG